MKYKSLKLILFMFAAVLFFSACGDKTGGNEVSYDEPPLYEWGKVTGETITVWGDRDDLARPYMVRAFEDYEEQTGNTIEMVSLTKSEINEKLPHVFSTEGESRPDLLLSYGGTNLGNLNPLENFYDFTNAPWIDDLSDTALTQAVFNGKVLGLPHGEASISGTLYNKKVFKKYKLELPKTQDEFMEVCEVLLKNGVTPLYLPYAEITMLLYQFPMDSFLQDHVILEGLNNNTLSYADIPEMKQIVQWYKTMADKGYLGENYLNQDWNGMDQAMQSGEYAMMLCWDTWIYTDYSGDTSNIGIMPAFIGVPENGCFESANIILCLANKNSPRLNATLDLINFMADPCNYNRHYAGIYTAPVYNNQSGSISTPQYMEAERLINTLFYPSTAWSRVRGFSQIDASYIQQYMQNEISIDDCLRAMNDARLKRIDFGN